MPGHDPSSADTWTFDGFHASVADRLLLSNGTAVAIGSRGFDILIELLRHRGELVSKQRLMEVVWPDTHVVEGNLTVHVSQLRRLLGRSRSGAAFIATVPGRGYQFVGEVASSTRIATATEPAAVNSGLLGRDEEIRELAALVAARRLVTVVGPPGIGKTSLAAEVLALEAARGGRSTAFIDFSPLVDGDLVGVAVAAAIGADLRDADPLHAITARVASRPTLVLLDNCEHLIDAAARLAHELIERAPLLSILATSREPLGIRGEQRFVLGPLASPPGSPPTVPDIEHFPATRLFVTRAADNDSRFRATDATSASIADICRRLDGVPLAIEVAAGRVATLGVEGVREGLADRLALLSSQQRMVADRHRSIVAAIDWSFRLLARPEQALLLQLSIFAGSFSREAVAGVSLTGEGDAADVLSQLVTKSLVDFDVASGRYRLLETVREYGLASLAASHGLAAARQRHAAWFAGALERVRIGPDGHRFLAALFADIDNIRAALGFSLGPDGDSLTAMRIAASSVPIWFGLSLHAECLRWMRRSLEALPSEASGSWEELEILIAEAAATFFTSGLTLEMQQTWQRIFEVAGQLGDADRKLDALVALWTYAIRLPDYAEAATLVVNYRRTAEGGSVFGARSMALWMEATTAHHRGELAEAISAGEAFLTSETDEERQVFLVRTGFDRRSCILGLVANARALQGFSAAALEGATRSVAEARALGGTLPLVEALLWAGYTNLFSGAASTAAAHVEELIAVAAPHAHEGHRAAGLALAALIGADDAAASRAVSRLEEALAALRRAHYGPFDPLVAARLASIFAENGRIREARAVLDRYGDKVGAAEGWCAAEFRRAEALVALRSGDEPGAMTALDDAIQLARRQDAAHWRLAAATTLARALAGRGDVQAAVDRLSVEMSGGSIELSDVRASGAAELLRALRARTGTRFSGGATP